MTLAEILDAVEAVRELDDERRRTVREEYAAFERGDRRPFSATRRLIERERSHLERLEELLAAERQYIDELAERTAFLTVEQAVRHREQALDKLAEHNDHLQRFVDAVAEGLAMVETNLDIAEREGLDRVHGGPESSFEVAAEAIARHEEAIDGLETNLKILNAYLI